VTPVNDAPVRTAGTMPTLTLNQDSATRISPASPIRAGYILTFTFDSNAALTALTWPDGKSLQFLCENPALPWAMTARLDANGMRAGASQLVARLNPLPPSWGMHAASQTQPAGSGSPAATSGKTHNAAGNMRASPSDRSKDDFDGAHICYAYEALPLTLSLCSKFRPDFSPRSPAANSCALLAPAASPVSWLP